METFSARDHRGRLCLFHTIQQLDPVCDGQQLSMRLSLDQISQEEGQDHMDDLRAW